MAFQEVTDLLPNCINCKYFADCPTEWIEEAGGYCENWEANAT